MKARFRGNVLFQHKAVGVEQLSEIDIAMRHRINGRTRVNARQALAQFFAFTCHVGFGQQDAVGVAHLRLGDGELVHLLVGMDRIHQSDDAVQQVALADDLVGEKGLNNRAGVGHAGALDHQTVEDDVTAIAAVEQVQQGVF
ncbi:Uncharacterised protein [Klebsiella pneumoniae]|nr:Uncharacterised protein [Klebsiella pneumoniae]